MVLDKYLIVSAIIVQNDAILLVKNKHSVNKFYWGLPGGKVEAEESLNQAIFREVFEETGIILKDFQLAYIHESFVVDYQNHVLLIAFQAELDTLQEIKLKLSDPDDEILEQEWVPISSLSQYITNEAVLAPLNQWLSHRTTTNYNFNPSLKWSK